MATISITGRSYYVDPINPSPEFSTAAKRFIYSPTKEREMYTITSPTIRFQFHAPPTQFELDGFGSEISEIKRPYSIPIADIYGGKLRRLSFECALVHKVKVPVNLDPDNYVPKAYEYLDGVIGSIEEQIDRLTLISDSGIPVAFENMSPQIQQYSWMIDDMKLSITRDDATGNAVAGKCTLSFIEFRPSRQRFILMPRFAYGVPAASGKRTAKDETNNGDTATEKWIKSVLNKALAARKSVGKLTWPIDEKLLQSILQANAETKGIKFDIPNEWITEFRNRYSVKDPRRRTGPQ